MTTSTNLETVTQCLAKLHGYTYFRPQDGALKARLSRAALDHAEDELRESLSHVNFGFEASIGPQEGESDYAIIVKVDHPGVSLTCQIGLRELTDAELEDLARYLVQPVVEEPAVAENASSHRAAVKRAAGGDDDGHHEKGAAAARLKVSPEWLKSVVPCTDYSYEEIEGKKYIREYFWSKELIERLFRIKCSKTTPEDLQYVAKECCEGDLDWAKDLIARLKSPNRPEPAPKEQPQKIGGKTPHMPQVKISPPRPPHGKFAPSRPVPGSPVPANPGQERAHAAHAAGEAAGQAKAGAGKGAPAGGEASGAADDAARRERSRRSRHRKIRHQRKEGDGKPDSAGDHKPPPK